MCLVLYVGLNKSLEPVSKINGKVGFYISEIKDKTNYIFQNITKRFVYLVGSAEGCGCSFLMDGFYPDMEEWADIRETYSQLADYFENAAKGENLQLYYCWESEESGKPEKFHQIELTEMKKMDFSFKERHFYSVKIYS